MSPATANTDSKTVTQPLTIPKWAEPGRSSNFTYSLVNSSSSCFSPSSCCGLPGGDYRSLREQKLPVPSSGGWGRVFWWWHLASCLAPAGGGGSSGQRGCVLSSEVCVWKLGRPCVLFHVSSVFWLSLLFPRYGCSDIWLLKGEKEATNLLKWSWNCFVLLWGSCVKEVSTLLTPINIKFLLLVGFAYGKEEDWPLIH